MTADRDERLRREGMADAAVLLVWKRIMPTLDLEDWARALDLRQPEIIAAITRFRERMGGRRRQRPKLRAVPSEPLSHDRKGHAIITHGNGGYVRGCRCGVCRDGAREYQRERRARAARAG